MIDFLSGILALAAMFWLPGAIFLRNTQIDWVTRLIVAIVASYLTVSGLVIFLGAVGALSQPTLFLAVVAVSAAAAAFPLTDPVFETQKVDALRAPLLTAAAVGGLGMIQALRPSFLRVYDSMATWAPWAREIGDSGDLTPEILDTAVEGFPPSVALISGSTSLLTGGFAETHMFIVHPLFLTLALVSAVMLGGHFAGRNGAWIALLTLIATPLIDRGVMFHDDLAATFFTATAVLLALRASRTAGWALAGAAAGAAMAIKHLGIVAVLLGLVVLYARRPAARAWLAASAAALLGLPWYLFNVIRFGNPVYPMLAGIFGENPDVVRVISARNANLASAGRGAFSEVGIIAIVIVLVGFVTAWRRAQVEQNELMRRFALALAVATAVYLVVWDVSGYATRHILIVLPALGGLAGYGLGVASAHRFWWLRNLVPLLAGALVVILTVVSAGMVISESGRPDESIQTGIYSLLRGKTSLPRIGDPPTELTEMYRDAGLAWEVLRASDPNLKVFSVDGRSHYYPQENLVELDVRSLPILDGVDTAARHAALIDAGVGWVLDNRQLRSGRPHEIMRSTPFWEDVRQNRDLYERVFRSGRILIYRVIVPSS